MMKKLLDPVIQNHILYFIIIDLNDNLNITMFDQYFIMSDKVLKYLLSNYYSKLFTVPSHIICYNNSCFL